MADEKLFDNWFDPIETDLRTKFESLVVGSGATSTELAAGGLKDLIAAPAGACDNLEGGDVAVQFVTQSAAIATPAAVLEDYRLASVGRRFADAAKFVQAYPRDLPRLKALLPSIETPVQVRIAPDRSRNADIAESPSELNGAGVSWFTD